MAEYCWILLTILCVINDSEGLLHGQDASIEEFPHVVVFVDDLDNPQPYCQGVLLPDEETDTSASIVLTTANCMCRKDGKDYVLKHLTAIMGGMNEPSSVTRQLRAVRCMPDFDLRHPVSAARDIAVVTLSTPVEFTDHIRGIDYPSEFSLTPESECYVASYGPIELTDDGPDIFPNKLQKMKMRFVEDKNGECGSQIQMSNGTLLCAESLTWPNRTAAGQAVPGDEGSAMVCRIDGRLVFAGLQPGGAVKVIDSVVFDLNDEL